MAAQADSGIYEIVNLLNGKRYIGSAVSFRLRWKAHLFHLTRGTHHSRHLQASWTKHGEGSFEFRILTLCERQSLLFEEQTAFDLYKPEYNIQPKAGSPLGVKATPETRAKLSASKMGNQYTLGYRHRPESIAKLSASKLGNTHTKGKIRDRIAVEKTAAAHKGMKRSEETKARISAAMKGKKRAPFSVETRAKLSAAFKGRSKSPEHIAKLQLGRKNRVYTEEQRAQISEGLRSAYAEGRHRRDRDPEYRAKIRATLTGRTLTPEHCANVAAAMRGKKRGPYKLKPKV